MISSNFACHSSLSWRDSNCLTNFFFCRKALLVSSIATRSALILRTTPSARPTAWLAFPASNAVEALSNLAFNSVISSPSLCANCRSASLIASAARPSASSPAANWAGIVKAYSNAFFGDSAASFFLASANIS